MILAPQKHKRKIVNLIHDNRDVVAYLYKESERTQSFQMKIDTGNHSRIKLKPYRTPIHERELVEESQETLKSIKVKELSNKLDTIVKEEIPIDNQHIRPSTWTILTIAISLIVVSVIVMQAIIIQPQL